MLKNINIKLPEDLCKKVELFAAELNMTLDKPMTAREVMMLAIAQMVSGEHLLEEYYEQRHKHAPRKVKKVIKMGRGYMDELLDKSIGRALSGK